RHQLGLEFLAEHARRHFPARTRDGLAAQGSIYMYAPVRDDLRAGTYNRRDDEIAMTRVDALARAHRVMVHQSRGAETLGFRLGSRRCCGLRRFPLRRSEMSQLRLHSKLREHRQIERSCNRFDRRRAMGQTDRAHAGTSNRLEERAYLCSLGLLFERTQIEADGGAIEELGSGGEASGELLLQRLCVQ